MYRQPKKQPDLRSDLEAVLIHLCADWGYCHTGRSADDFLSGEIEIKSTAFARRMLIAEGMDPDIDHKHMKSSRTFFKQRYGECVSAKTYRP